MKNSIYRYISEINFRRLVQDERIFCFKKHVDDFEVKITYDEVKNKITIEKVNNV
jgi:hypothetical protein